jgi:thioesterase domain-containing protein
MSDVSEISEAKRTILEKYLRGELPQTTVDAISRSARESSSPQSSTDSRAPLVAIQTDGPKQPFFYMHVHWKGGAFYSFPLARDLGTDQPFYVLDTYSFDGLLAPPTFETMAADYVKSLRAIQPEGPYLLGGFCGGGLIAFEVAQQLRVAGQAVDLLVLIDPMAGPILFIRSLGRSIRRLGKLLRLGQDKQLDWFLRLRNISRVLRRSEDEYSQHSSLFATTEELRQEWMGKFVWMVSDYTPRPYTDKMTYFWAREKPTKRKVWWGKATETEGVEFYVIDGTHESCRTEHLYDLARHLRMCLSRVQGVTSN